MVIIVKRVKLGFEMFTVIWSGKANEMNSQDFWSENAAISFVSKTWKHINIDNIKTVSNLNNINRKGEIVYV